MLEKENNPYESPNSKQSEDIKQKNVVFLRLAWIIIGILTILFGIFLLIFNFYGFLEELPDFLSAASTGMAFQAGQALGPVSVNILMAFFGGWICKRGSRIVRGKSWKMTINGRERFLFPFYYPIIIWISIMILGAIFVSFYPLLKIV